MSFRLAIALLLWGGAIFYAVLKLRVPTPAERPATGAKTAAAAREEPLARLIRSIPRGRVITFSALASRAGPGFEVSKISRELRALSDSNELPWWRVVRKEGSRGLVSSSPSMGEKQRRLLGGEGVKFQNDAFVLADYQWEP